MSAQTLFDELNLLDEHTHLEGKLGREVGRSVWETICAFANEPDLGGGTIFLGVRRNESTEGPRYLVAGVSNPDKIQSDLASQCATAFNTTIRPQISVETLEGKTVVLAYIPESSPSEKPIFIQSVGLPRGAYRRIGSTDQFCTLEDLSILFDGRGQETFDYSAINGSSLHDLDLDILEEYRRIRRKHGDLGDALTWSDEDLLKTLGCMREVEPNLWVPTVAGIMLFGSRMALRRWFPMFRVDYIRVPGKEWIDDPENRFEVVEYQDTLFQLIQKTQAITLEDLPRTFSLREGQSQREDLPLIPQRVIREALVNAMMHRSYQVASPIQIVRYSNRIEIRNPGYSIKATERLGEPGSFPRNPHIAAVLHETRFAETKGSGIKAMNLLMGGAGLPLPSFESSRKDNQFRSCFLLHHLLDEEDLNWLAKFKDFIHAPEDAQALVYVREFGKIDNSTYRSLAQVDTLTASSRLRRLRDDGLLEARERGAATFYVPTQFLLDPVDHPLAAPRGLSVERTAYQPMLIDLYALRNQDLGVKSPEPTGKSPEFPSKSPESPGQSPELSNQATEVDGSHSKDESIPSNIWPYKKLGLTLEASLIVQNYPVGRKAPKPTITKLIQELCSIQDLTSDQIAMLLRREKDYVIKDYLTPMINKGLLNYTIQGAPTHPRQAYTSAKSSPSSPEHEPKQ